MEYFHQILVSGVPYSHSVDLKEDNYITSRYRDKEGRGVHLPIPCTNHPTSLSFLRHTMFQEPISDQAPSFVKTVFKQNNVLVPCMPMTS